MSLISNLVHQGSTSSGTGAITLVAQNGRQSFYSAFGTGGNDMFFYFISHKTAVEWEAGTGHLSNAATLVRDTVIVSSNSNAFVNFSAGDKDIINDIDASRQLVLPLNPATGDILYHNGSGWTRLVRGSDGQFLSTGVSSVSWASLGISNTAGLQAALDSKANSSSLSTVATTGAYSDLTGKPTLGSLAAKNSVDLATADATGALAAGRFPALTGDVTNTAGALATTIATNAVANSKLAQMSANTIKGNNTGATGQCRRPDSFAGVDDAGAWRFGSQEHDQ